MADGQKVRAFVVGAETDIGRHIMRTGALQMYRGLLGRELWLAPETARYNEGGNVEVRCVIETPGMSTTKYLPLQMIEGVADKVHDQLVVRANEHKREIAEMALQAVSRLRLVRTQTEVTSNP